MSETSEKHRFNEIVNFGDSGELPHAPLSMPKQRLERDAPPWLRLRAARLLDLVVGRRLEH